MITACISLAHHDSSLCVLKNNKIDLFIQEERITKIKHSAVLTDEYLKYLNRYKIDQLILVNFLNEKIIDDFILKIKKEKIKVNEILIDSINHHLFHASSAFYLSGFKNAVSLIIDGWGTLLENNFYETTSIYKIDNKNNFITIFKNLTYDPNRNFDYKIKEIKNRIKDYELNITHRLDVGVMYGTVSKHIGFERLDGGKTMGLSGYGKKSYKIPDILYQQEANMNFFKNDRTLDIKNKTLNKKNLAFAMQKALEKIFVKNIKYILKKTKAKNIVFSGGCALNILGNSMILKKYPNIKLFVDPIPTDAGQSIGAAYYYYFVKNKPRHNKINNIYLGPLYNIEKEIKNVL